MSTVQQQQKETTKTKKKVKSSTTAAGGITESNSSFSSTTTSSMKTTSCETKKVVMTQSIVAEEVKNCSVKEEQKVVQKQVTNGSISTAKESQQSQSQQSVVALEVNGSTAENEVANNDQEINNKLSKKKSFSKFDRIQKKVVSQTQASDNPACKACGKTVYLVELIKAEKASWHKGCFRCTTCTKSLGVDTYASHEGKLYCKPHHRQIFSPQNVVNREEVEEEGRTNLSYIIKENIPTELPSDVVRGSEDTQQVISLEEMGVDVRSRWEVFEKKKDDNSDDRVLPVGPVKRSATLLSRLGKFEGNTSTEGIPCEELGEIPPASDDDEDDIAMKKAMLHDLQMLQDVQGARQKWVDNEKSVPRDASTMAEERKGEMMRFRSRLCQGKSTSIKQMFENGVNNEHQKESEISSELEHLNSEKARKFREMFEKGEVFKGGDEDEEDDNAHRKQPSKLELSKFEKILSEEAAERGEEVQVDKEKLAEKLRFFQEYNEKKEDKKKKVIDIYDGAEKREDEDDTIGPYVDPTIIKANQPEDNVLQKSKTASKMLEIFRQLEENKEEKKMIRPPKAITPPREDQLKRIYGDYNSDEEDRSDAEENGAADEEANIDHKFLKEVGSLARARSLRAKFERWEQKQDPDEDDERGQDQEEVTSPSIESAKALKALYEQNIQQDMNKKRTGEKLVVRRFK